MLRSFIFFLLCVFLLCGCSFKQEQEVLNFISWGSITETKILKTIISDFEKENPNIKINFIHTPQNYFQKLHLLFASNTEPDVIFINNYYLPLYESLLLDLSDFVDKRAFYPIAIESLSYNGKLLAVPRDISSLILYINNDMVTDQKDWKIEDMLEMAKSVTTQNKFGIGCEEDIYWILPYLSYFGEEFNSDFNPQNSKGLKFYKDLKNVHKVCPTKSQIGSNTLAQMFLDKKIAIYLSGRWMYPKIKEQADFNWVVKPFPKGSSPFPCDASGWAISKKSKNKKTAMKFINYLSSEKSINIFAETGLIVPARIESSKKLNNKEHNERAFLEVLKYSKKTPVTKNYKKLADDFNSRNFN